MSQHLHLKAVSPAQIVAAMLEVPQSGIVPDTWWRLEVQTNLGAVSSEGDAAMLADKAELRDSIDWCKRHEYALCHYVRLSAIQHPNGYSPTSQVFVCYQCSDGIHGTIEIAPNLAFSIRREIAAKLSGKLNLTSYVDLVRGVASNAESAALQIRERSVADLEAQVSKLGDVLANITAREVEARDRLAQQQRDILEARLREIDEQQKEALAAIEARRVKLEDELSTREAALAERTAKYETRESKHVRRHYQNQLDTLLDTLGATSISKSTAIKRRPVIAASIVMGLVFGVVAAIAGMQYFVTPKFEYLAPFTGGLLGLSAMAIFFLKWSDRWFREHAEEETYSRRYKADMLRASWIAEFAQEWAVIDKEVPKELTQVFARNLFTSRVASGEVEHPLDQLLGLLKRARRVDLSKGRIAIDAGSDNKPSN